MWVASPSGGFYSAVEDSRDPSRVIVRARLRQDLVVLGEEVLTGLLSDEAIIEDPERDYPFYVRMSKKVWAAAVGTLAMRVDYPVFRDAVIEHQGPRRAEVYELAWASLTNLEPGYRARRDGVSEAALDAQEEAREAFDGVFPVRDDSTLLRAKRPRRGRRG